MDMDANLEVFVTGDGSPTLTFARDDGYIEKMHHSAGAFSESLYIYHRGLTTALDAGVPPAVISVGLGLAYNELICLAEFIKRGMTGTIWSFEALPVLREQFVRWAGAGEPGATQATPEYTKIMEDICTRTEAHFGITGLKTRARTALESGELKVLKLFPEEASLVANAGVIFYDAFSNKMSPELWQEEQLRRDLEPMLAPRALLCTYAQTGALKRVLKSLNFTLVDRPSFRGKRGCTLATRF